MNASQIPHPDNDVLFVEGVRGSGKTSTVRQHILHLLGSDVPAEQILVLVPDAVLAMPYRELLSTWTSSKTPITLLTFDAWVRSTIQSHSLEGYPYPTFSLLADWQAQYLMEMVGANFFGSEALEGLRVSPQYLITQIFLVNKLSAYAGLSFAEGISRLKPALGSRQEQLYAVSDAIFAAYTAHCDQNHLLDMARCVHIFRQRILPSPAFDQSFRHRFKHLIVDNIEEFGAVAHEFLEWAAARCETTLLLYDPDGGHRVLQGADPDNVQYLPFYRQRNSLEPTSTAPLAHLTRVLGSLEQTPVHTPPLYNRLATSGDPQTLTLAVYDSHLQMLNACLQHLESLGLAETGSSLRIAIIMPSPTETLRRVLQNRLRLRVALAHQHSRIIEVPMVSAALVLLRLIGKTALPTYEELRRSLIYIIPGLDYLRADLLVRSVYRNGTLSSYYDLDNRLQNRITQTHGSAYERMRTWIQEAPAVETSPLHEWLTTLREAVLRPAWTADPEVDFNERSLQLVIDCAERLAISPVHSGSRGWQQSIDDFLKVIRSGYLRPPYFSEHRAQLLLISPLHFLQSDSCVEEQIWLDVSHPAWLEYPQRLLVNPYVLRRNFSGQWNYLLGQTAIKRSLTKTLVGLTRRCGKKITAYASRLNASGFEQQGMLLTILQQALSD